jgi:uncharacterized protein (TIGR03435 family)
MNNRTAVLAGLAVVSIEMIFAQPPATTPPEFDAASLKPVSSAGGGRAGTYPGILKFTPGMVSSGPFPVTAGRIILEAYHLHDYQLAAGPDWVGTERFALEGKAETAANEDQLRLMLQTLLSTRFRLVVHRETREMPVWALTVDKGGPRLHELKPGEPTPSTPEELRKLGLLRNTNGARAGTMIDRGNMQTLADELYVNSRNPANGMESWPVLDKTGLKGEYLLFLQWDADEDFKDVVREVMGLKLEARKAPVEVLVIDHIERPSGN